MYIVYCQNKPKSEHIVSEYIDNYFEVGTTKRNDGLYTPRTAPDSVVPPWFNVGSLDVVLRTI